MEKQRGILIFALLVILGLVAIWHLALPLLGVTLAITAGAWGIMVSTIVAVCVSILLLYVLAGIGILLLSVFIVLWVAFVLMLFPLWFPVLTPLLIVMLFIAYRRRRKFSAP